MQKIIIIFLVLIIISTVFLLFTNGYMIVKESSKIVDVEKIDIKDFDTILILGAGVKNNQPSPMLTDRLNAGVSAYNLNLTNKIIVSGEHGYHSLTLLSSSSHSHPTILSLFFYHPITLLLPSSHSSFTLLSLSSLHPLTLLLPSSHSSFTLLSLSSHPPPSSFPLLSLSSPPPLPLLPPLASAHV